MSFPVGVIPLQAQIECRRGITYKGKVTLYSDKAKTVRLNLTGLTVRVKIGSYLTLKSGEGLTITAAQGEIEVKVTPSQTKEAPNDKEHFWLEVEESPTEIVEPLEGTWLFRNP